MSSRFLASSLILFAATIFSPLFAQEGEPGPAPAPLVGRVEGKTYIAPNNSYRIEIPVLPELGGSVHDTETVVTFQDEFNVHSSIASFTMDATQRWENETRGRKDYLIWFFGSFIQADFQQRFPGAKIESARFLPSLYDGALLTYNILPGGSMFEDKIVITGNEEPPVAKRGNLLFVKNGYIFVVSIELAEKVLERSTFKKTVAEEDEILRKRLLDLAGKITFTPPPKPAATTEKK